MKRDPNVPWTPVSLAAASAEMAESASPEEISAAAGMSSFSYIGGPDVRAYRLRGLLFFYIMAAVAPELKVSVSMPTEGEPVVVTTQSSRVNIVYLPVPTKPVDENLASLRGGRALVGVILDCHFPLGRIEDVTGPGAEVIQMNGDVIRANLALADAATVPHAAWAADITANNVFVLPDLDVSLSASEWATVDLFMKTRRLTRKDERLMDRWVDSIEEFSGAFNEVVAFAMVRSAQRKAGS